MVRTNNDSFAWHRVENMGAAGAPPPSCCQSMVHHKEKLYMFGGAVLGTTFSSVYAFDLERESWSEAQTHNAELASSRMSHSTVVFEERMIVFGGMNLHVVHGDLLALDLQTLTWSVLPCEGSEHPGVRRSHAAALYKKRMFVSMGLPSHPPPDLWWYDFDTCRWCRARNNQLFGAPPVSLHGHTLGVNGDSLFMFGGCIQAASGQTHYSNALYQYNVPANVWSHVRVADSPRPSPRYAHVMAIVLGRLVIHGGDSENCTRYYDDLWLIELEDILSGGTGVWQQLIGAGARRPCARSGHCAAVFRDTLYTFGGEAPGTDTMVFYSGQLYSIPLSMSTRFPLADLCARWLAKTFSTEADEPHRLPPRVAATLQSYRCIEKNETLSSVHF